MLPVHTSINPLPLSRELILYLLLSMDRFVFLIFVVGRTDVSATEGYPVTMMLAHFNVGVLWSPATCTTSTLWSLARRILSTHRFLFTPLEASFTVHGCCASRWSLLRDFLRKHTVSLDIHSTFGSQMLHWGFKLTFLYRFDFCLHATSFRSTRTLIFRVTILLALVFAFCVPLVEQAEVHGR